MFEDFFVSYINRNFATVSKQVATFFFFFFCYVSYKNLFNKLFIIFWKCKDTQTLFVGQ